METINWAQLDWVNPKTPRSTAYDDVYFSSAGVLEEYRHVFHLGNDLHGRWKGLKPSYSSFGIGELGFGTGLGFLSTWKEWLAHRPEGATLHYLSFEKNPVSPSDLSRIHSEYPELAALSTELLRRYPPRLEGIHRLRFEGVVLTLVFSNALTWARKLVLPEGAEDRGGIDAWFLHGFAPQKNPDLWSHSLFESLVPLSKAGATCSTFSVANAVQENLSAAGFALEKVPGFAQKREMLRGRLRAGPHSPTARLSLGLRLESHSAADLFNAAPSIAVIGAGLAGSACAHALAERGFSVKVFEREPEAASKASGNLLGFYMPFLATEPDHKCRIALRAFSAFHQAQLNPSKDAAPSGALEIASTPEEFRRFGEAIRNMGLPPEVAALQSEEELQKLSGLGSRLHAPLGGVFYPAAGFLNPGNLCQNYLAQSNIELRCGTTVESLRRNDKLWEALGDEGQSLGHFTHVIVANAIDAKKLLPQCELPLTAVRGQVAHFPSLPELSDLRMPIQNGNYLTPAVDGSHVLGATHTRGDLDSSFRPEENTALWNSTREWIDGLPENPPVSGRVGFRAYSPDAIAAAGPAVDFGRYSELFGDLAKGYAESHYPAGESLPGLFLSIAHGSRGISSSLLAAEIIASVIAGEILPIERDLVEALHPARFALRRLRKKM